MDKRKKYIISFVVIITLFQIISSGRFITPSNIMVIISHAIIPSFIVWAFCFIFSAGIVDLSLGAIMILTSNIAGYFGLQFGYPGLIIGGLVAGGILSFFNSVVYSKLNIPSWIAGLAMTMIYESGMAYYSSSISSKGGQIPNLGNQVRALGSMPYMFIFWILGFILAYVLFNYTAIGLNLRAVGSNDEVSAHMGVNINKSVALAAISGGVLVGLSGAVNISYAGKILAMTGMSSIGLIFQPLAAFLIAGALTDYFNIVTGSTIGVILVAALFNFLTLLGVPSGTWQEVILGFGVISIAILSRKNQGGLG